MILASAQTNPKRWDIDENLNDHYRLIEKASKAGVQLIVFPEMSITGYETEDAYKVTFEENDARLDQLKKMAVEYKMIIIAGAPVKLNSDLFIGSFIFLPYDSLSIYTKQFLHPGEEVFYKSDYNHNPLIEFDHERISLAICADIDHAEHAQKAHQLKSSIYMPSIFFSPRGIPEAYQLLSGYAQKYAMNVLMANFSGESSGMPAGGKSAFWDKKGALVAAMDDSRTGLLLVEKSNDSWSAQVLVDEI